MIDVTCRCGHVSHSEEQHIGKHLRCPNCGEPVPILDAPRAIVRPPHSSPQTRTNQPRERKMRRFQSAYVVAAALGIVLLLVGVGLFVHVRNTSDRQTSTGSVSRVDESNPAPQTGTARISDIDESAAQRQTADSQQGSSAKSKIIGEEPIPRADKPTQLLDPRPTHYNSPATGTRCEEDIGTNGHGELTVENGTSEDAVVRLSESDIEADQTLRCFFVQAHSTGRVARIPEGTYRLTFMTGLNWVESEDVFSWQPSYSEFQRAFDFSERRDSEGVQYHSISVTLHAVPLGNVRTRAITREEFLKGHRHVALRR